MTRGRRTVAIVPAGGLGVRLGGRVPKQYLTVGGVPLLVRTLRALGRARSVDGIVVAVPVDRLAATRALLARFRVRAVEIVAGGAERQDSVWNGLQATPADAEWIVVHDAVRPFLTRAAGRRRGGRGGRRPAPRRAGSRCARR